jgi:hypothetical protein
MLQLAVSLLRLSAAEGMRAASRRLALALCCGVIAALAGFAALGCAVAALWSALLPPLGPVWTPVVIGLVFAVISVACLLGLRAFARPRARPLPKLAGKDPVAALTALLSDNRTGLLLGAVVLGIVAGRGWRRR